MIEIITNIISGIIIGITTLRITEQLTNKKIERNLFNKVIILIFSVILIINYFVVDNFLKVIVIFLDYILLNKIITKERLDKSIVLSFIEYLNALVAEIIVGIIMIIILKIFTSEGIEIIKNTIFSNIVIMLTNYIIAKRLIEQYRKIIEKTNKNSALVLTILAILILLCIGSLFYKIDTIKWELNNVFLLNAVVIVVVSVIGIMTIFQRLNYEKIANQYKDLAKYSEVNATLLEEYSILNHEHKNQLIIIKGMIEEKDKGLEEYVKKLIDKKEKVKFKWIKELNNISFQGLKSFMNYKILEMKEDKIEVYVTVSKQCKNYKLEKMTTLEKDKLYSIIGVYLDNAKDAAKESKGNKVVIDMYITEEGMVVEIANTFNGTIDLEKINDYGYTSKGTGHGTGLYMIQNIVKDDNKFKTNTKINNEYFIQTLIIK